MIACDKFAHLWIGSALAMPSLWAGPLLGALPIIAYAVGKEAWDHAHPPNKADLWDFLATMAGGALPLGLIELHRHFP